MTSLMSTSEFKRAQAEWYARLKEEGFEDIEDHSLEDKPLKRWSGINIGIPQAGSSSISIIDLLAHQEAGMPIQSSFPEKRFGKEERLLNHASFDSICDSICGHGNHKLVVTQVRTIWEMHTEGEAYREIARLLGIHKTTVYRCLVNLKSWAETLGED